MVDFIAADINKFEEQMINYIEAYYNILKEKEKPELTGIEPSSKDWCDKIIDLLNFYYNENSKVKNIRKEEIVEYLNQIKEKAKQKVEFFMVVNIAYTLYGIYYYNTKKNKTERSNEIKYKRSRCVYKEIIELRNEISHIQNRFPLEDILRIYEDFYYLIKFMKPDNTYKVKLDEQFLKEIKINIHIYLQKNLNYDKSFELNELYEEFKKFDLENKKIDISPNTYMKLDEKLFKENTEKAIESLFEFPTKLSTYKFKKEEYLDINEKNLKNDDINKEDNDDDQNENENNIDNYSNDSISEFSISSSNSERYSINEIEGNIKKSDDNTTFLNSKYDIQKDI